MVKPSAQNEYQAVIDPIWGACTIALASAGWDVYRDVVVTKDPPLHINRKYPTRIAVVRTMNTVQATSSFKFPLGNARFFPCKNNARTVGTVQE